MTILIPAYQPTEKMIELVSELRAQSSTPILIVDDGSGQKYQNIFQQVQSLGCTVLTHPENKGKGAALKTGFSYLITSMEEEGVVCADCDGQHSVEDILKTVQVTKTLGREMVLGVRTFDRNTPLKSRIGNRITSGVLAMATGSFLSDTQTGLRGYPSMLLPWLCSMEGDRYEYELNLLLYAREGNVSIRQIPIRTIYENRNSGSHFRVVSDSIRVYLPLLRCGGSSMLSGLVDFFLLIFMQYWLDNLFFAVVLTRAVSSLMNYLITRHFVFQRGNAVNSSAPRYFSLVVVIMLFNYVLLSFFTATVSIPLAAAKILTEIILFLCSYVIQKRFVFSR
jgi:glycosyltransferase involved in cell wall biosynthesis